MTNKTVNFWHGENSRISNKIIKALKESKGLFKITSIRDSQLQTGTDEREYTHRIEFISPNKAEQGLYFLRNEITAAITELFPVNYFFAFTDEWLDPPFNWKFEFWLHAGEAGNIKVFTKIQEQKPKSAKLHSYKILTGLKI